MAVASLCRGLGVTARQLHDANVAEVDFNALILKEYLDEFNGKIPA